MMMLFTVSEGDGKTHEVAIRAEHIVGVAPERRVGASVATVGPQWGHSGATMIQTVADTEEDNGWSVVEEYTAVVARIDMVLRAQKMP